MHARVESVGVLAALQVSRLGGWLPLCAFKQRNRHLAAARRSRSAGRLVLAPSLILLALAA